MPGLGWTGPAAQSCAGCHGTPAAIGSAGNVYCIPKAGTSISDVRVAGATVSRIYPAMVCPKIKSHSGHPESAVRVQPMRKWLCVGCRTSCWVLAVRNVTRMVPNVPTASACEDWLRMGVPVLATLPPRSCGLARNRRERLACLSGKRYEHIPSEVSCEQIPQNSRISVKPNSWLTRISPAIRLPF